MPTSLNASLNVSLNSASLNASSKQIKQALGRITGQASEFQKSLDASTARVFAFGATTAVLNGVTQSFKKLVATTVEVQKRLIEINSIFQATESSFNKFRNAIFQVAKETGQSFGTVAEGAAELARQGLSAAETAERLKAALVLTRISGMDAEKSVKALTAAINGFTSAGLTANQIVNKMVAVDTAFAVSTQDLAEAFSRAGSTAEDAGVNFNELLGLITAVEQRTARGGAVIGNAFKSIFTRLSRGSTIESLKELGVSIDATQSGIQKLQALSNALEKISDPTIASEIKELAGGVFQINVVSAALKDLGNDTSVFKNAAITAATATNEAFEKNKALGEAIAHQMNALVIGLTSLAEKIGTITFGPILESLLGVATTFTEFLDKALDPEKGNIFIKGFFKAIGKFLGGPAIILFTAAFAKIVKLVAKFAIGGLKSLFAMGTQVEKIRQIEGGIVGLLGKDVALRRVMESSTSTLVQKEQAVIAAIQRENTLLAQQAQLMRTLAAASAARGVSGFNSASGLFGGRRGTAFASGFRAEEAQAMMLGAPAGVKGKRGSGTIGGRKFIMNNHETEIPRFGRNGDSAVIPHYSGGFVPNYAMKPFTYGGREITKASQVQWLDKDGKKAAKAAGYVKGQKKRAYGSKFPKYDANEPTRAIMLLPQQVPYQPNNLDTNFSSTAKRSSTRFSGFQGGSTGIDPNLKSDANFGKLINLDSTLDKSLAKGVNIALRATLWKAKGLKAKPKKFSPEQLKKLILKEGGAGAFGAIRGAAFEAIIHAITGGVKAGSGGNTMDVNLGASQEAREIFGLDNVPLDYMWGDFKNSLNTKDKYISQVMRSIPKKGAPMPKGKARGFIPNYAEGPINSSKIRVHKSSLGEPLAVTNTRDEPKGLRDAIAREKKGVGMFSGGFVPNYAKFDSGTIMMGLFALQGVFATFAAKQEQNIATLEKEGEARDKNVDLLEVGLAQWAQQRKASDQMLSQKKEETSVMDKLMGAANAAATALLTLTTINALTGGGAGKYLGMGVQAVAGGGRKHMAGRWTGAQGRKDAAIQKAADRRVRYKAELKKGPALDSRGKPMSLADQRTRARTRAGYSGKDLELDSAKRRASKAPSKMGKVGKFAGKAGIVAALAFGAYDIGSTLFNKDLNKEQKNERIGKKGTTLAGGLAGAAVGQAMIPIPVVGALIGGVVGAGLAKWGGDAAFGSDADEKRADSEEKGEKLARKEGLIGFDQQTFESLANQNLEKIAAGGGDAEAVAQRYTDALKNRADLYAKENQGEEQSLEAHAAAKEEVIQAAMLLADTNFRDAAKRKENSKKLGKAEDKLWWSQTKLADAYTALKIRTLNTVKLAKDQERDAGLKVGLKGSIKGPMAKAVGLASEQNLMQKEINTARAEKSAADAKLAEGVAGGKMDEAGLEELRKAAKDAGDEFRDATYKAGTSFLNAIKKTEDLIAANKKKRIELDRSFFKSSMDIVGDLISGKTGGDVKSIGMLLTDFAPRLATMKRDRRMRVNQGHKDEFTKEELFDQAQFWEDFRTAIKTEIGEGADPLKFLEDSGIFKEILATMKDPKVQKAQRDAQRDYGTTHDLDKTTIAGIKKATAQADKARGTTDEEAIKKLKQAHLDLAAQLATSQTNYNKLLTLDDTKEHAKHLLALQKGMEAAAESYQGVKTFVQSMSKETDKTADIIKENAEFVIKQKALIISLTEEVEDLQIAVDQLKDPK